MELLVQVNVGIVPLRWLLIPGEGPKGLVITNRSGDSKQ